MRTSVQQTNQRRGSRTKAVLPVRVKGKNSSGKAFEELAHTLDVTLAGARLGSIRQQLQVGDELMVFYRQRKMQFRVVWTRKLPGTSEFQVGLETIAQEREAWGIGAAESRGQPASATASGAV